MSFCLVSTLKVMKKNNIPLGNIATVATDRTPAMVSHYRRFATLLKEKVPNVYTVQFYINTIL